MTVTASVYFTLNNVDSNTYGWEALNPLDLMRPGPIRQGTPTYMPGLDGAVAAPSYLGPLDVTIDMIVYGHRDADGMPYSDVIEGLQSNLATLGDAWGLPSNAGNAADSTSTLTLTLAGGSELTGSAQVLEWTWQAMGAGYATGSLRLWVPTGQLVEAGP